MKLYDFKVTDIGGNEFDFAQFEGKKVLIVNTASECGFTPQFEQLEELYQAFKDSGLVVIGFPTNDFGAQDPGSNEEIAAFCQRNYGVSFPMMSKIAVKGDDEHPLFKWLQEKSGIENIKWNFEKFLVDTDGETVKAYRSQTLPIDEEIINWVNA